MPYYVLIEAMHYETLNLTTNERLFTCFMAFILDNIQGDSKPLRQTMRVDRVNNKENFLLNNLCLLTRRFEITIDFC